MLALPRRSRLLLSWTFICMPAVPAFAQDATVLDTLLVQGKADGTTPVGALSPIEGYVARDATTGSKTDTPIAEIPQAVSVVGQDELKDRGVEKVDEALRYTAGVFSQPFGSDADTDWIYVRGFDATQTGMFLGGLQLFSYAFAGITVDPFLVDRIEVLRGPASVLYGGSSAGGIVNLVPKLADGERRRYVEAGVDDNPNGYVGFDLSDVVSSDKSWSYRVVGKVKGGDTQTNYADNFRGAIAPSLLYEPDADTSLKLYASYQYDDQRHTNGFFPYVGTVARAPYGYVPRDLFYSEPDLDKFRSEQTGIGYDFEHRVNDHLTLKSKARWIHVHRSEYGPYTYDVNTADNVLDRINFAHDTHADLGETDNQAIFSFDTGPVSHKLMTGFDYKYYRIDQWQASGAAGPLDPISPDYTNTLPPLYAPYADETVTMNQLGAYVQDQMKFGGGFIATLNGRFDEVWIDRNDRTALDADYDGDQGEFSGRAGLAYEFENGLTPYVSVSRFFEPQIGTDANNQPVKPQTGEQYEAGIKYSPTFLPATFTASVFDLTRRNTLQTKSVNGAFVTDALGEVRSRGIELEAKADLTESLKATAAFTTYDLEITDDVDPAIIGKQPYLVPQTLASLWLDYTFHDGWAKGFGLGGGVRYKGVSYADNENTLKVPDATVFDAALHYDRDNWGADVALKNVFDKRYVAGCQTAYSCGYGEGRTVQFSVHASF